METADQPRARPSKISGRRSVGLRGHDNAEQPHDHDVADDDKNPHEYRDGDPTGRNDADDLNHHSGLGGGFGDPEVEALIERASHKLKDASRNAFEIAEIMNDAKSLGTTRFAHVYLSLGIEASAAYKYVKIHEARQRLKPLAEKYAVTKSSTLHEISLMGHTERQKMCEYVEANRVPAITRALVKKFRPPRPSKRTLRLPLSFSFKLKKSEQLTPGQMKEVSALCRRLKEIGGEKLDVRESEYIKRTTLLEDQGPATWTPTTKKRPGSRVPCKGSEAEARRSPTAYLGH
jgi:hypothetical protein